MNAIDTNVLLRILVDDPTNEKQCELARQLASNLEELYITQIAQVELVWVLKKAYKFSKEKIVFLLETLATNSAFELQRHKIYVKALAYYQQNNVDFSDCIILSEAEEKKATPLYTFDKKLAKLINTQYAL